MFRKPNVYFYALTIIDIGFFVLENKLFTYEPLPCCTTRINFKQKKKKFFHSQVSLLLLVKHIDHSHLVVTYITHRNLCSWHKHKIQQRFVKALSSISCKVLSRCFFLEKHLHLFTVPPHVKENADICTISYTQLRAKSPSQVQTNSFLISFGKYPNYTRFEGIYLHTCYIIIKLSAMMTLVVHQAARTSLCGGNF